MSKVIRYNYHCRTKGCSLYAKQAIIEKNQEYENEVENCDECDSPLYCVGELSHGGYLRFSALSSNDKKKVLKKRADLDYKKNVEERKMQIWKNHSLKA